MTKEEIKKPIKDVKMLLTQNIQRAINKADRCGKIPLGRWVPDMCATYGLRRSVRHSERDEEEIDEDEDKKYVLGDILEELD